MNKPRMIPIAFDVAANSTAEDAQVIGEFVLEILERQLKEEAARVPLVCGVCGAERGLYIPDACIGKLPGVGAACCGHGDPAKAYVSISLGPHHVVIEGQDAIDWMHEVHEATK